MKKQTVREFEKKIKTEEKEKGEAKTATVTWTKQNKTKQG